MTIFSCKLMKMLGRKDLLTFTTNKRIAMKMMTNGELRSLMSSWKVKTMNKLISWVAYRLWSRATMLQVLPITEVLFEYVTMSIGTWTRTHSANSNDRGQPWLSAHIKCMEVTCILVSSWINKFRL